MSMYGEWDDKSWHDVERGVGQARRDVIALEERIGGGGGGISPAEVLKALAGIKKAVEFAEAAAKWAA